MTAAAARRTRRRAGATGATGTAAALLTLVTAGCGGGPATGPAGEPARAPEAVRAPAGRVVDVGPGAEGVAVTRGTVAVATRRPERLVLVDVTSGAVTARLPLAGHARHLSVSTDGRRVLVPVEDDDRLVQVDVDGRRVARRTRTGEYPHGATALGRSAVVGDEFGGTLTRVARDGGRTTTDGFEQPGGVAATDDDRLLVVDVATYRLTLLDPDRPDRRRHVQVGSGPTHLVVDRRGDAVVADTRGDRLFVVEVGTGLRVRREVPLPGAPYGIAYDAVRDTVWVTLTATNELVGLTGPDLRETVRLPTVRQPNTVAVDPATGTVAVASRTDGLLQLLDPTTRG